MTKTDKLVLAFGAFVATTAVIFLALAMWDIQESKETQQFINIVSDSKEENDANIQNYINNNLK